MHRHLYLTLAGLLGCANPLSPRAEQIFDLPPSVGEVKSRPSPK